MHASALERLWYGSRGLSALLAPLGALYGLGAELRRSAYRLGVMSSERLPVPVVVVGNIAVGGTGKTPLTIWLADHLGGCGYTPGIVCSGYGGRARSWPQWVGPGSDPDLVGDEAVLLARRSSAPVAAGPDRVAAAVALLERAPCDVIVSDDGLQHYALQRDVEIAVVDGVRRHGTGRCFPAGPLREPRRRLHSVDLVVANGAPGPGEIGMAMVPEAPRRVDGDPRPARCDLRGGAVHAVAGIGHPDRFFELLRSVGYTVIPHPFPDHHRFRAADLAFAGDRTVIMTEKDAVKCCAFATPRCWYLPVRAVPDPALGERVLAKLAATRGDGGAGRSRRG